MKEINELSLELAKKIAQAAEQKAKQENLKVTISIFDNHGNLKYLERMDHSNSGSVQISQLKAKTSAVIPISTRALQERSSKIPTNPYAAIPGVVLLVGGLPIITKSGQHLGGIGVSGATSDQDEMCAQVGLDAVAAEL